MAQKLISSLQKNAKRILKEAPEKKLEFAKIEGINGGILGGIPASFGLPLGHIEVCSE